MIYARYSTTRFDADGTVVWEEQEHVYALALPEAVAQDDGLVPDVVLVYAAGW